MKHLLKLLFAALALTAVMSSCNGDDTNKDLVLTPSKTSVVADGEDAVAFTVKYGEEDVTATAVIKVGATAIEGNTFTTTTADEYKFTAEYDGKTSPEVTITATEPAELVLSVDKTSFIADGVDQVTFTVLQGDEDVTAQAQLCTEAGICLPPGDNVFSTNEHGEYEFYATIGTLESNHITVVAEEITINELVLLADKEIVPMGDVITFTVMGDGNDVTALSKIVNVRTGEELSGASYTTVDYRKEVFKAIYREVLESETIEVQKEVPGNFYKMIAIPRLTGTWCGWCHPAAEAIKELGADMYAGKLVPINMHGSDEVANADATTFGRTLGMSSYPNIMFDFRNAELVQGWSSKADFSNRIARSLAKGTTAGLAIDNTVDGNIVTVKVTVWSSEEKEYHVGVVLLEDKLIYDQVSYFPVNTVIKDYEHNNVLRKINDAKKRGVSVGSIPENHQVEYEITFDLERAKVADAANCKIAVFVNAQEGSAAELRGVNAAVCSINESIDFKFESAAE